MIIYDDENSLNNQDNYNSFSDGCNLDSDRPLSDYLIDLALFSLNKKMV